MSKLNMAKKKMAHSIIHEKSVRVAAGWGQVTVCRRGSTLGSGSVKHQGCGWGPERRGECV